ncbi:MAG: MBL fold metallo-hydrolase [Kiritimatiellae bacterium]|nr:MBL fold metallo-hydrolase [Kiritimatiellia bacterium]
MNEFVIRGTRGGTPVPRREFLKYGGNTTCFTLETAQGILVFDAGTGIASLHEDLAERGERPPVTILFTHFHMDHVMGLPFFDGLYMDHSRLTLVGDPARETDWRATLRTFVGKPYWPIGLGEAQARLELEDLPSAGALTIYGVRLSWCPLCHPQESLAYRVEAPGVSVVVATDHEPGTPEVDERFLAFCRGAGCLICDAEFTPEEYPAHRGWGHGTWAAAARLAEQAGVGRLILTHHNRYRQDAQLDAIVAQARAAFANTDAASEGLVLTGEEGGRHG